MIPDEAVEAAAKALRDAFDWGVDGFEEQAKRALEAAAPHLMAHEREQTRLAHLDAMVNRETKQAELSAAWQRGVEDGYHHRPNPYIKQQGTK